MILVTGGAGFIGSNFILDWIAGEQTPVINLDKLTYAGNLNNLAALEGDTSGIILTNNILPPSNIISKASEKNIPLLMVFSDTYQTAKQIESLEPLLTREDTEKVELFKQMVENHVQLGEFKGE